MHIKEECYAKNYRHAPWGAGSNTLFYGGYLPTMMIEDIYYVNKYEIGRAYGGPEEGGWWYDYGIFEGCEAMFTTYGEAREFADALTLVEGPQGDLSSVTTGHIVKFFVEEETGAHWPGEIPQYE